MSVSNYRETNVEPQSSAFVFALTSVSRAVMVLTIMSAPWVFGGVWADSQYYFYAGMLTSLAIWIPAAIWQSITCGIPSSRLPLVLIPTVAGLWLMSHQLAPSPVARTAESIQSSIQQSLQTAKTEDDKQVAARAALIEAMQTDRSIAPAATRMEMSKLFFVVITIFLSSQLFATQTSQLWLWGSIAINGAALTFFGIMQQLSWDGKIYWYYTLKHGGLPFASYVNRNNAAGYLCLCLACTVGLTVWIYRRQLSSFVRSSTRSESREERMARNNFDLGPMGLTSGHFVIMVCLVWIASGIVLTSSRGGWLALCVASTITGLQIFRSKPLVLIEYGIILVACSWGLVGFTGLGDRISNRWGQVANVEAIAGDARWTHWIDSIQSLKDFQQTGVGFGAYRYGYLPYQTHMTDTRFYNADNQFLEWTVEGGMYGLAILLCTIVLFAILTFMLLRRMEGPELLALGVVGLFLMISQFVSGFFDYGPTMPANALAIAAIVGSIAGRAGVLVDKANLGLSQFVVATPKILPTIIIPIAGCLLVAFGIPFLREVETAAAVDSVIRDLPILKSNESVDLETLNELISRLTTAVDRRVDDAESQLALAELLIHRFRKKVFQEQMVQAPNNDEAKTWAGTDPLLIYSQVQEWKKSSQFERIDTVIDEPGIRENLSVARNHLLEAQAACPMIPDVDRLLAVVSCVGVKELEDTEVHLRRALILAPVDPGVLFEIGCMAYVGDLKELAFSCWNRSLRLSNRYLLATYQFLSKDLTISEQIKYVLPDSPEVLVELGQNFFGANGRFDRYALADRAIELLKKDFEDDIVEDHREAERRHALGRARFLVDEPGEAIVQYRKALAIYPNRVDWRLELVDIFMRSNQLLAALKEAEVCQILEPNKSNHEKLVRHLRDQIPSEKQKPNGPAQKRKVK